MNFTNIINTFTPLHITVCTTAVDNSSSEKLGISPSPTQCIPDWFKEAWLNEELFIQCCFVFPSKGRKLLFLKISKKVKFDVFFLKSCMREKMKEKDKRQASRWKNINQNNFHRANRLKSKPKEKHMRKHTKQPFLNQNIGVCCSWFRQVGRTHETKMYKDQ